MKIQLTNPCSVDASRLTQAEGGSYCSDCKKTVIDYSYMSDAQYLNHIKKHGLGCGQFRDDQLDRDIIITKRKKKNILFYFPFLIALFFKQPTKAQCRPDTIKIAFRPDWQCKQESYAKLEQNCPSAYDTIMVIRKFGTGNIATIRKTKSIGFYWRKIRITLFRIKTK